MKKIWLTAAFIVSAGLACGVISAADEKAATTAAAHAFTNKEVMQKAFKGDNTLTKTVLSGKADEAALKQYLEYAQSLNANKPKKGDEAAWKERTKALVDATQGLLDKKEGALDSLKTATNCMSCHSAFR